MNQQFANKCWWCQNPADSGEHKFKKSDIKTDFGDSFSDVENYPLLVKSFKNIFSQKKIQGPNSDALKFDYILCKKCNNERSQAFDSTYTKIMSELISNNVKYENHEFFDFRELYGNEWKNAKLNFMSYFVKHFCCRLYSNSIQIPESIIRFLNRDIDYLEYINFNFTHRLDLKRVLSIMNDSDHNDGFLEIGNLTILNDPGGQYSFVHTYLTRKWIKAEMYFSRQFNITNFPNIVDFYNSPIIPYKSVSIFDLDSNCTIQEITETIKNLKSDSDDPLSQFITYLNSNPYKTTSS